MISIHRRRLVGQRRGDSILIPMNTIEIDSLPTAKKMMKGFANIIRET